MRTKKPARRALNYACTTPWAIREEALAKIIQIAARLNESPEAVAAELGRPLDNTHDVTVRDGVATLPISGPLFHHANLFSEVSGASSYDQLATDFQAALASPDVRAILLAIDSPGGEVGGASDLSEMIFNARGQKPIVAHIGGLGASAAYWIGSAADRVILSETALAGSIGVLMSVMDYSEDPSQDVEFVSSQSPNKIADPSTKDGRARIQAIVDELASIFVANVARNRGVSEADVLKNFGKGDVLVGRTAVKAGLADRIATFEATHAKLATNGLAAPPVTMKRAACVALDLAAELEPNLSPVASILRIGPAILSAKDILKNLDERLGGVREVVPSATASAVARSIPSASMAAHEEEDVMVDEAEKAAALAKAEAERREGLMSLGEEHEVPIARIQGWIGKKISVEAAGRELLAEFRAKAQTQATAGSDPLIVDPPRVTRTVDRAADKPFGSFGEQLFAIARAGMPNGHIDPRLKQINLRAGTPSGSNETVGSEGGYFIQPTLLPGIIDPIYLTDPILSRVTRIPITTNGVKFNVVDETSRATGSRWGAIQMYWVAEADTAAGAKPKLRQVALDLKKLMGIGYLTDELLEDAPAMEALMIRAFTAELQFMLTDAIFRGLGGGQPLGFQRGQAVVSQAIEGTQTIANTSTFISQNVAKMLARVPASLWDQVIWLYQQELLPSFINATIGAGTSVPIFIPIGGLGGRPSDTLLGRSAYASEFCEANGTPGDFWAIVPSQYVLGDKGGVNQATSLHIRFLYDEMALRITYRVDGQPLWYKPLTPYKGANSRSPYVNLAVRV